MNKYTTAVVSVLPVPLILFTAYGMFVFVSTVIAYFPQILFAALGALIGFLAFHGIVKGWTAWQSGKAQAAWRAILGGTNEGD